MWLVFCFVVKGYLFRGRQFAFPFQKDDGLMFYMVLLGMGFFKKLFMHCNVHYVENIGD